jgi:type VI secretion system protein ImpI
MTLRLSIENLDRLPDGGPLRVEVKGRGLDLGRDAHLDWTLPDPSRTVSSKHCEIRFRDGGYWLHDVSTNGTFVNGAQFRLDGPYMLRDGDRLAIGPYIIAVAVQGQLAPAAAGFSPAAPAAAISGDVWGAVGEAAAPDDRAGYRIQERRERPADFLDFAASVAPADPIASIFAPPAPGLDDWLSARPASPPPAEASAPPTPTPRRAAPGPPPAEAQPVEPRAPSGDEAAEIFARIARAAGIPESALAGRDPRALAEMIGAVIRSTAHNLAQLLASRAESKTLMRSSSRTMVRAFENNPLKFAATPEEALAIMFGPPTRSYLDAPASIEMSFADIKAHEVLTFGAMQAALEALFDDLAPERIDRSAESDHGLAGLVGSRKAKLWDIYLERWRAKTKRSDGRLAEAFMTLFAEAYDRLQKKGP